MSAVRFFRNVLVIGICVYVPVALTLAVAGGGGGNRGLSSKSFDDVAAQHAQDMVHQGRQTFRYDTFGDEDFWGGVLQLHRAIEGANLGGIGPGLTPRAALALGLKVDLDALLANLRAIVRNGRLNVDDPATTLALLRANAIVGVTGFFDASGHSLRAVGIQCALCHSRVDDALAPGIGHRLDGWPNQDLDIGTIVSLAPNLQPVADLLHADVPTVKHVLTSWGPGKFDAELFLDGKGFQPDGRSAATLIPPAFGLAGVNLHTWEGWGSVTHWNAFVANLEMHGHGTFFDPRLDNADQFPIAAANGFGHVTSEQDRITAKLPALHFYQLALPAPAPPVGTFDAAAAARGDALFEGKAKCTTCHTDGLWTEPGWNMHRGEEIGIDDFQADRGPDHRYRTSPLKGIWTHMKRGFYHDGRFATLLDVVNHYDGVFHLALTDGEKHDVVEYVKSLSDDVPQVHGGRASLASIPEAAALEVSMPEVRMWPSPLARGGTLRLALDLAALPADLDAAVYDVSGRRIATVARGTAPGSLVWDGRDAMGRSVDPGIYFVRVTAPSLHLSQICRLAIQ